MAFFNEIGKKISQVGQEAVKSTKDIADIARLNTQISDEQKLLSSFYMQIGKKYYELYPNTEDTEFSGVCNAINETMVKITNYREEVKKIKGIKKCSNCGSEVPLGTTFCGACGNDTTKNSQAESTTRRCPNCNKELSETVAFCTDCGQKV